MKHETQDKCTCNFSDDTASKIGHYEGCPMYEKDTRYKHETQDSEALTLQEEIAEIIHKNICDFIVDKEDEPIEVADQILFLIKSRLPKEIDDEKAFPECTWNEAIKE